jgi:hypothetical protein
MQKKILVVLAAGLLIFVLGMQMGLSKESPESDIESGKIIRKLDEVLFNQAEILKQFSEIKQDLQIIKIRSSR